MAGASCQQLKCTAGLTSKGTHAAACCRHPPPMARNCAAPAPVFCWLTPAHPPLLFYPKQPLRLLLLRPAAHSSTLRLHSAVGRGVWRWGHLGASWVGGLSRQAGSGACPRLLGRGLSLRAGRWLGARQLSSEEEGAILLPPWLAAAAASDSCALPAKPLPAWAACPIGLRAPRCEGGTW